MKEEGIKYVRILRSTIEQRYDIVKTIRWVRDVAKCGMEST
jgi:hypothetical protein